MGRSPIQRICRGSLLMLLLSTSFAAQGCMAVAWVAAVAVDSMRISSVSFERFESTWVSSRASEETARPMALSSVAVLSIEGEDDMGRRLAEILRRQTALRVEQVHESLTVSGAPLFEEQGRGEAAKQVAQAHLVDAVMFGRVTSFPTHPGDRGWKEEESRRLFLYLVDRDGHMLWKDELPYKMVIGSKPILDGSMQASLSQHLMNHVRELGLDTLGYLPSKSS